MLGAGAEHWVSTLPHMKLKATRHAVQMQPSQVRAWYGMMTMVPDMAIVQENPQQQTFADMKHQTALRSSHHCDDETSIGCGHYEEPALSDSIKSKDQQDRHKAQRRSPHRPQERHRLLQVQNVNACDNVTSFLLLDVSYLDIPDAEHMDDYLEDDYSLFLHGSTYL
ncbi:hypothetical protein ACA910_003628 [Epithemia clementina (nom. ined.)]